MTGADLLALSAERDAWLRRLLAAEACAYRRGFADGLREGAEAARREQAAAWQAAAERAAGRVPLTDLERRRWGPGGRDCFGDPRPGDFRGVGR